MATTGEKVILPAEIIRGSIRAATEAQITEELSLLSRHARTCIQLLKDRNLLVFVDQRDHFPSEKGLAYLRAYDKAADLVGVEGSDGYYSGAKSNGAHIGIRWDKAEPAARMGEIIGS